MKRNRLSPVFLLSRGSWRLRGSCCSRRPSVFGSRTEEFCLAVKSAEFSCSSRSSFSANCCAKAPTTRDTSSRTASRLGWLMVVYTGSRHGSLIDRFLLGIMVLFSCVIRWVTWRCRTVWTVIPVSLCCGLVARRSASHCRRPLPTSRWPGWTPSPPCWTPRTTSCQVSTSLNLPHSHPWSSDTFFKFPKKSYNVLEIVYIVSLNFHDTFLNLIKSPLMLIDASSDLPENA